MSGLEFRLVFPYLGTVAVMILSAMGLCQWVWERFDPSRRYIDSWIDRTSDYVISVAYVGASLSIPAIYYDAWKAGRPGPSMSYTAETILYIMAVGFTAVACRVSVKYTVKLWKETKGLPVVYRCLWALGAFSVPFVVVNAFEARKRHGGGNSWVTQESEERVGDR